jgi:hypothetical protein
MTNAYYWLKQATIKDYDSIKAFFDRARFPDKGKPLRSSYRIHKDGDDYIIKVWNGVLCRFKPNNTVVFTATSDEIRNNAQTVVGSLHRAIPFSMSRIAKGRYRVAHNDKIIASANANVDVTPSSWWNYLSKDAPEYFQGITFDLATNECLNPRPDDKLVSIPEKRLHWLRALREFKKGIKIRAKMNVFDGLSDTVEKEGKTGYYDRPDWSHEQHMLLLFESIKNNEFPQDLLLGITKSFRPEHSWTWHRPKPAEIVSETDRICTTYSVELRRHFGVFERSEYHS